MILIHEHPGAHIEKAAQEISKILDFKYIVIATDFSDVFQLERKHKELSQSKERMHYRLRWYKGMKSLVFTPRDIYKENGQTSKEWLWSYTFKDFSAIATARLKRYDDKPSQNIIVPEEKYIERIIGVTLRELGYELVKGKHLHNARQIKQNGKEKDLGFHCIDNKCVMYAYTGINALPADKAHVFIGGEQRTDSGLDELLDRRYPEWFCKDCKNTLAKDVRY